MSYKKENQSTNATNDSLAVQVSNDLTVQVIPHKGYEFLLTTQDVARGYGVAVSSIRSQKSFHRDELREGVHFVKGVGISNDLDKNRQPNQVYWTKAGVIRLGFFISSDRAKAFRDWAEGLILSITTPKMLPPAIIIKRKHNRLTPSKLASILADIALIDSQKLRESLVYKLTGGTYASN